MSALFHITNLYFLIFFSFSTTNSANILAITPFPSLANTIPFVPLFQALSEYHNLTVITSNPMAIHPRTNVRVIDVSEVYQHDLQEELIEVIAGNNIGKHHEVFRVVVQNPYVREILLDKTIRFDLVLADITSPIWSVFGLRYSCPVVGLLPQDVYLVHMKMGTPTNPAVHSDSSVGLNYDMNTFDRIYNIFIGGLLLANDILYTQQKVTYYLQEYFPRIDNFEPTISMDLLSKIALLLVNQIPGFHKLRATTDNTLYIGSGPKYLRNFKTDRGYQSTIRRNLIVVYIELDRDEDYYKIINELHRLDETIFWVKQPNLSLHETYDNIQVIEQYEFQDILNNYKIDVLITNGDNHLIEISFICNIPFLIVSRDSNGQEKQNIQKLAQHKMATVITIQNLRNLKTYIENFIERNVENKQLIADYAAKINHPISGIKSAMVWLNWLLQKHSQLDVITNPIMKMNILEAWYIDIVGILFVTIIAASVLLVFLGSKAINFITVTAAKKELVY